MRLVAGLLFLVVFLGASGWVAAEPEVDPGLRDKIDKLLELTGARQIGKQMGTEMLRVSLQSMRQDGAKIGEEEILIATDYTEKFFEREMESLIDMIVPLYARHFTEEEIDGLIEFYDSPLGRKVTSTLPALMQEGMQAGVTWAEQRMPELQAGMERALAEAE